MSKKDSIFLNCKVDDNLYQRKKCMYINPIQDGHFRGCSRMWSKKTPPLKSVTHILQ